MSLTESEFIKAAHKDGFLSYLINIDQEAKDDMINAIQYTILGIIPITTVLFFIRKYVPDPDEEKSSLVILAEIIGQLSIMFVSIIYIDRLIQYVPTFSGTRYHHMNIFNLILGLLMVLLTIQTKLGEKSRILVERIEDYFNGNTNLKEQEKPKVHAQPQGQQMNQQINQVPPLPTQGPYSHPVNVNMRTVQVQPEALPNYNKMYANTQNPLQNAATPGMGLLDEPLAANEALGGHTSFY